MIKDLNDALNAAKEHRGVFSKTIIWESGVSKSQFYRIIGGKESPSAETRQRIADSLELELEVFDKLFAQSNSQANMQGAQPQKMTEHKKKGGLFFALVAVLGLGAIVFSTAALQRTDAPTVSMDVAMDGDKTLFIKDVTIPDGTAIPVNTSYVKTWRVKNIGNVVWKKRYLKRMTPTSPLLCSSPAMVPIPETKPGETIDISVTFKTPHLPGSCRTDWKTADDRGNLYFPDMHGLYSIVTVVQD